MKHGRSPFTPPPASQNVDGVEVITWSELTSANFELVSASGSAIVVAERHPHALINSLSPSVSELAGPNTPTPVSMDEPGGVNLTEVYTLDTRELGTYGHTRVGGFALDDYNSALRWPLNLDVYDRMRKSDGTIRGALRLVKTPILGARWYIEGDNEEQVDFVSHHLLACKGWTFKDKLNEALSMLDFGHYFFEKVWERDSGTGEILLKDMAPRHPKTVDEFDFDTHGRLKGVWFTAHTTQMTRKWIPARKLLTFTFEGEAGDVRGMSILRSAHKHWFYKDALYKIDAIQKERHAMGVPVIKLPPGWRPADRDKAQEWARNLRTNELAHLVLPPHWEVMFLKPEGLLVNPLESIGHHDKQIFRNVLADFLYGQDARAGSAEVGEKIFDRSVRHVAEECRDVFNREVIPEMLFHNFPDPDPTIKLRFKNIGQDVDWQKLSFAIRNFIGAGVIKPDDKLEDWLRHEMDLPTRDPETAREVSTPQLPEGEVGEELPRQSQAANTRDMPSSAAGDDRTGG